MLNYTRMYIPSSPTEFIVNSIKRESKKTLHVRKLHYKFIMHNCTIEICDFWNSITVTVIVLDTDYIYKKKTFRNV